MMMTRRRGRGVASTLLAVVVAELLLSTATVVGAEDAGLPRRRSLHQPFFPIDWSPPPSASDDGSLVPPLPPSATAASKSGGGGRSRGSLTNTIAIALAAGLVALAVAGYSCFLLLRRRSDDGATGPPPKPAHRAAADARVASDLGSSGRRGNRSSSPPPSSTASDAIYIDPLTAMVEDEGQLRRQQSPDLRPLALVKPPSPDLRPLPPLKKRQAQQPPPPPASTPPMTGTGGSSDDEEEDVDTFYTARRTAASSFSRSTSQRSTLEQSSVHQPPAPITTAAPPSQPPQANSLRPPRPPPPPPPPRQRLLRPMPAESPPPPALASLALTSSAEPSAQDRGGEDPDGRAPQQRPPSLKPLHWDKLRAISGRTTVWDQVNNSDSFRVDEAAMESLFTNKAGGTMNPGQAARSGGVAGKQETRLLDPKRLQNVAIMLKALNVTSGDVTAALVHGNGDLRPEFYEALAKMAPTKEEELRLKDYRGDLLKIDPAERFLKDVLDVPFAFKRVDAMLYRANFDSELNYLRKSFETLEAACADLRSSKLFLKLLDAVLKTGNRMNDGTNRGEARAFKLDTLLKLADIKSTDGKTTVLHFVVQELIRSEGLGSNQTGGNPGGTSQEQFKKDGLKVLAGLSSELSNVKRAATLEMDTLISNVSRLETDLEKVKQVLQLKETCPDHGSSDNFFDEMDAFLGRAQVEIAGVKVAGESALRHVKDTTEYFHGDATKEEPHHLRIFMVVSDFLSTLDRVCRDVGRTPERVMMGSGKSFRVTAGTSLPPRRYQHRRELSCSSDEDSSSS